MFKDNYVLIHNDDSYELKIETNRSKCILKNKSKMF